MSKIVGRYEPEIGPLIEVSVVLPGQPVEQSSGRHKFLIDTGACLSCIAPEIVEQLSLLPVSKIDVGTPIGPSKSQSYIVDIVLFFDDGHSERFSSEVLEYKGNSREYQGLIGRDILQKGDFHMSRSKEFTFTYSRLELV